MMMIVLRLGVDVPSLLHLAVLYAAITVSHSQPSEKESDACSSIPCGQFGVCVHDQKAGKPYHCDCATGYHGNRCQLRSLECAGQSCQHGGQCVATPSGFQCQCSERWAGLHCAEAVRVNAVGVPSVGDPALVAGCAGVAGGTLLILIAVGIECLRRRNRALRLKSDQSVAELGTPSENSGSDKDSDDAMLLRVEASRDLSRKGSASSSKDRASHSHTHRSSSHGSRGTRSSRLHTHSEPTASMKSRSGGQPSNHSGRTASMKIISDGQPSRKLSHKNSSRLTNPSRKSSFSTHHSSVHL